MAPGGLYMGHHPTDNSLPLAGGSFYTVSARRLGPRHFCVDMAAFAFDAALLQRTRGAPAWAYRGRPNTALLRAACTTSAACAARRALARRASALKTGWRGGETELLETLLPNGFPEDLQPLANCGHDALVVHNGFSKCDKQYFRRCVRLSLWSGLS